MMIALKTNNTLWAWGRNSYGALGLNDIIHRSSPVQIGTNTNWSEVRNGSNWFWFARKSDGTIWGSGRNHNGMLGQNDINDRSSPCQIGSISPETGYRDIVGGSNMGIALQTDTSP